MIVIAQMSRKRALGLLIIGAILSLMMSACSLGKKIQDGRTAHQQKQYALAVEMLEKEAARESDNPEVYAEISYLLGESYKYLNNSDQSLRWFIEAAKNDYGAGAYWEMGYALKKKERYGDAILSFRRLEKLTQGRTNDIRLEIEKCRQAQILMALPGEKEYILKALALNSQDSDYAPAIWNGSTLVFTSDRRDLISGDRYAWTGNSFSDLFISEVGVYAPAVFEGGINTPANEGTATFSQDGKTMYFTQCHSDIGDSYCRIMRSDMEGKSWSRPVEAMPMKHRVNYGDPVLIEEDEVLIMSSNDPTGIGGHDLYYSVLEDDGSWSVPELMPAYLNSLGEERFPTWDGKKLYYSSDFFTGLGGLDIFSTSLNDDGSWTKPENLLAPFNSPEDDYSYVMVQKEYLEPGLRMQGFFTSTRGIYGNDDIYSIVELRPEGEQEIEDTLTTEELIEKADKTFFLNIKVVEPLYAIPDNPNSFEVGNRPVSEASVKISSGGKDLLLLTDTRGIVRLVLDSVEQRRIIVGKVGYLNQSTISDLKAEDREIWEDGHTAEVVVEIDKIYEGLEVTMENIYYDLDKDDIRDDAKPSLDALVDLLAENPMISIELNSHTDCQGADDYNQDLSQRRAQSAVAYMISKGVGDDRLTARGYGESVLEISCVCDECSEEEHQINRRTTFKIVK